MSLETYLREETAAANARILCRVCCAVYLARLALKQQYHRALGAVLDIERDHWRRMAGLKPTRR